MYRGIHVIPVRCKLPVKYRDTNKRRMQISQSSIWGVCILLSLQEVKDIENCIIPVFRHMLTTTEFPICEDFIIINIFSAEESSCRERTQWRQKWNLYGWYRNQEAEALPRDIEVPVVVTGAGLAGILTAYYLKQVGIRTVVLEADRIGRGETKSSDGSNAGERKTEGIYMMTYCGWLRSAEDSFHRK